MCTIEKYSSPIKNNADQGESQIKNEYNFGHLIWNAKSEYTVDIINLYQRYWKFSGKF